jgi:GT2 family glycosyltransferase
VIKNTPSALAVIVNYNAGDWLQACVESIRRSDYGAGVVVVDNASTDDSIANLGARGDAVRLILNTSNVGFARANNQVLENHGAEFYVLVNPDCRVEADTIGTVISAMRRDNDIALASCLIKNADGSTQKTCRRRFPTPATALARTLGLNVLWPEKFRDFDYGDGEAKSGVEYVEAISGAFMVVRATAMDSVGYLDEGYFMHCEDLDWCKRFWQAGFKVAFIADTFVTHAKGVSGRTLRVNWYLHQGMLRFYRKFYLDDYPRLLFALVYLGVFLSFLGRSTMILLRGPHSGA